MGCAASALAQPAAAALPSGKPPPSSLQNSTDIHADVPGAPAAAAEEAAKCLDHLEEMTDEKSIAGAPTSTAGGSKSGSSGGGSASSSGSSSAVSPSTFEEVEVAPPPNEVKLDLGGGEFICFSTEEEGVRNLIGHVASGEGNVRFGELGTVLTISDGDASGSAVGGSNNHHRAQQEQQYTQPQQRLPIAGHLHLHAGVCNGSSLPELLHTAAVGGGGSAKPTRLPSTTSAMSAASNGSDSTTGGTVAVDGSSAVWEVMVKFSSSSFIFNTAISFGFLFLLGNGGGGNSMQSKWFKSLHHMFSILGPILSSDRFLFITAKADS